MIEVKNNLLKTVPAALSKLSNLADNDVDKKTVYDKLVTKVNTTDTKIRSNGGLVTKTQYNSDKQCIRKNWARW